MKRTNYAGETSEKQVGQEVVLKGWVAKRRNLGGLIFIDLWDREGIVQPVSYTHLTLPTICSV